MMKALLLMLLLLRAGVAVAEGWPCEPCTSEQIRELGIAAPPPKVREDCRAVHPNKEVSDDARRWFRAPVNVNCED